MGTIEARHMKWKIDMQCYILILKLQLQKQSNSNMKK